MRTDGRLILKPGQIQSGPIDSDASSLAVRQQQRDGNRGGQRARRAKPIVAGQARRAGRICRIHRITSGVAGQVRLRLRRAPEGSDRPGSVPSPNPRQLIQAGPKNPASRRIPEHIARAAPGNRLAEHLAPATREDRLKA